MIQRQTLYRATQTGQICHLNHLWQADRNQLQALRFLFFFFFDLGFKTVSRIFHLQWNLDNSKSKGPSNFVWIIETLNIWGLNAYIYLSRDFKMILNYWEFWITGVWIIEVLLYIEPIVHQRLAKTREPGEKNTWLSISRTWLSNMWPERGSNHSCEKPNGLGVNSTIH